MLERFNNLVTKLSSTLGRLEKERFLKEVENDTEVKEILRFLFDPYIVTGISDKKLNKYRGAAPHPAPPLTTQPKTNFIDVLDYFKKNNTGRDEDIKFLVKTANATPFPELVYGIIKRDLKLGIQSITLNKVFGADFAPKMDVMLAEPYSDYPEHVAGKDFIITEKLDGVRCVLIFESGSPNFFSRNGKPILDMLELDKEVRHLPKDFVYDGELLLDNPDNLRSDDLYRVTVAVVNSDNIKRALNFNVFDIIGKEQFKLGIDPTTAINRKTKLEKILTDNQSPHVKAVPMRYVGTDTAQITKWLGTFCNAGGEGVMLNIASAPYECKRTKNLLKVKQFNTADVLVVDVEEGTGANRNKLGAVVVQFIGKDGKKYTCKVGSGFKLEERESFWADKNQIKGKIIEIGYFEMSRNQNDENYSLRFPTFKHLRLDKTEISMA